MSYTHRVENVWAKEIRLFHDNMVYKEIAKSADVILRLKHCTKVFGAKVQSPNDYTSLLMVLCQA